MRALLDVNVLIALLDADHVNHNRARAWLRERQEEGWASCPITQNGCARIMSQPAYPNALPTAAVITRLQEAVAHPTHEFWSDDVSILDDAIVDPQRIHGPRQLTDLYLLALAVRHEGTFVTLDHKVPISAVHQATERHLAMI